MRPEPVPPAERLEATGPVVRLHPQVSAAQLALYAVMVVVWGASFFFTAIALRGFSAVQIVFLRMAIATTVLAVVLAVRKPPWPRSRATYGHFAFLGAANIAVPYLLLTWAQLHVNSSTASILSATTPLFVFLMSWLVAGTERFNPLRGIGIIVAFLGLASFYDAGKPLDAGIWAFAIVLCSMIFAAGNVYTKRFVGGVHPLVTAFLQVGIGATYLLLFAWPHGDLQFREPPLLSVLALIELGTFGSALTYLLFFHFIQTWGSTATSLNTYFQPLVGLSLGVVVLGDTVPPREWIGLGVTLLGILIFGSATYLAMRRGMATARAITD
jgi:drug/metabolite transporter (DMT)-like permease